MKVVGNSVASFSARNIILLVFDSLCILSVFPYRNEVHLTGQLSDDICEASCLVHDGI